MPAERSITWDNQLNLGVVTYNGFIFPPALNSSVTMQPVYDRADRGLMYVKYGIRIEFVIHSQDVNKVGAPHPDDIGSGGDNWENQNRNSLDPLGEQGTFQNWPGQVAQGGIDHQLHFLRRILSQPGRRLTIAGIGLGPDLDINNPAMNATQQADGTVVTEGLYDVAWGPKPRNIRWEPIGSNSAARIVWECEVGLVECEDINSAYKERKPILFNRTPVEEDGFLPDEVMQVVYNESWSIDHNGMTTKNYDAILKVRGYIDAAMLQAAFGPVRGAANAQGFSADYYRWYFEPALLHGYLRRRSYKLNDDKTELSIQITDSEVASDWPFPPGVSDISADYTIKSSLMGGNSVVPGATGFMVWDASLRGSITMTKGFHPYWRRIYPYYIFILLLRSRFSGFDKAGFDAVAKDGWLNVAGDDVLPVRANNVPVVSVPLDFSISEQVFGRQFSFSFSWMSVIARPEKAAQYLKFGYPPNVFAENQNKVGADMPFFRGEKVSWDWDLWLMSMIRWDGASDFVDLTWEALFHVQLPSNLNKNHNYLLDVRAVILADWQIKAAPMSIHGADGLRFEGDARMEPCQGMKDFWYNRPFIQRFQPSTGTDDVVLRDAGQPVFLDGDSDPATKIIAMSTDMELQEDQQVVAVSPLNYHGQSSSLLSYVDGRSGAGTWGNTPVLGGLDGTISRPSINHIGDTDMSYDMVEWDYTGVSPQATKVQSIGAPKYKLRVFGQALTLGKPLNPPRVEEYGTAKAVKTGQSRSTVKQVTRGLQDLWLTKWDLWYDLIGTPNGVAPKATQQPYPMAGTNVQPSPFFAEKQTAHPATRRFG